MPASAGQKKRTERLNVRLSNREARLIRLGAERRGVNITNFILEALASARNRRLPMHAISS
jgi:uncharacterized protein (DUF1778 family)